MGGPSGAAQYDEDVDGYDDDGTFAAPLTGAFRGSLTASPGGFGSPSVSPGRTLSRARATKGALGSRHGSGHGSGHGPIPLDAVHSRSGAGWSGVATKGARKGRNGRQGRKGQHPGGRCVPAPGPGTGGGLTVGGALKGRLHSGAQTADSSLIHGSSTGARTLGAIVGGAGMYGGRRVDGQQPRATTVGAITGGTGGAARRGGAAVAGGGRTRAPPFTPALLVSSSSSAAAHGMHGMQTKLSPLVPSLDPPKGGGKGGGWNEVWSLPPGPVWGPEAGYGNSCNSGNSGGSFSPMETMRTMRTGAPPLLPSSASMPYLPQVVVSGGAGGAGGAGGVSDGASEYSRHHRNNARGVIDHSSYTFDSSNRGNQAGSNAYNTRPESRAGMIVPAVWSGRGGGHH